MELASSGGVVPPATAAAECSVFALHGIPFGSLPRRTVAVESRLAIAAAVRLEAKPQARARAVQRGKRRWHFTPKETRWFRDLFSAELKRQWGARQHLPCVRLELDVFLDRPEEYTRPSVTDLGFPVVVKPDFDNVAKAIADAAEGIIYENDSRIAVGSVGKWYVPAGERPWIEARFYELIFSRKKAVR